MAHIVKNKTLLFKVINLWPPMAAAGIKVARVTPDLREMEVQLKLRPWNKNVVGTHYGGSIYSMTDPWYVIMLMHNLGRDYIIWDKAAAIRFRNPGLGIISAKFHLTDELITKIKEEADRVGRAEPKFLVEILDSSGKLVAEVDKIISVRRKDKIKSRSDALNNTTTGPEKSVEANTNAG